MPISTNTIYDSEGYFNYDFDNNAPGNMDLAGLMNNPEMMAMAQNMMKSGALDKMMKDPNMMNMMSSMMGGNTPGGGVQIEEEEE